MATIGTDPARPSFSDVRVITADRQGQQALRDIWRGALRYDLWWRFAVLDIQGRFRRSVLGPLWITLSMAVMVGALGLVFGALLRQGIFEMLPYIATGLIIWGFINTSISEGCNAFIANSGYILNIPTELSVYVYRMLARNAIILAFNFVIYVGLMVISRDNPGLVALLAAPGFVVVLVNVFWISLAVAVLSARFRDIPQVVINVLQVVFYLTPVFWSPSTMSARPSFVTFNPLYHLLQLVRAPLLGEAPTTANWLVGLGLAAVGLCFALVLFRRAFSRISYWL